MNNYINNHVNSSNLRRKKTGTNNSLINIFLNILLFIIKFVIGNITNSISIITDSFNNLSDVGNNIMTFVGFYLGDKKADEKHPLGYGRYEYISALLVSVALMLFGLELLKSSISRIINPETVIYNPIIIIILIITIIIKLFMAYINKVMNKKIASKNLDVAFIDSLSDVFATICVLLSFFFSRFTSFPIDGLIGILISAIIGVNGLLIMKDTINCLIGEKPNYILYNEMKHYISQFEGVLGVHDLIVHDYGPSKKFSTVHVEMSTDYSLVIAHSLIENIEKRFSSKFNSEILIHMDPMDNDTDLNNVCIKELTLIVKKYPKILSFHECRVVKDNNQFFLIFDLVLIPGIKRDEINILKKNLQNDYQSVNKDYTLLINIEK